MPKYRAYQMDKEGRVIGLPDIITCDDDEPLSKERSFWATATKSKFGMVIVS
jgi:hypothetical protein